jgi:hypothetical protein
MKYNIVSGLRRSGTSLMMLALRQSGIPVIGLKYDLIDKERIEFIPSKEQKEGNPNGYWEMGDITTKTGITKDYSDIGMEEDLLKVMFECLPKSEPQMINKAIVISRNPDSVLKSILKNNKIKFPEMFIADILFDILDSFSFLVYNNISFLNFIYEKILSSPEEEMKRACDFLGNGDYNKAVKTIDLNLNRSCGDKYEYEGMDLWREIYELAKENKINGILDKGKEIREKALNLINKYDKNKL